MSGSKADVITCALLSAVPKTAHCWTRGEKNEDLDELWLGVNLSSDHTQDKAVTPVHCHPINYGHGILHLLAECTKRDWYACDIDLKYQSTTFPLCVWVAAGWGNTLVASDWVAVDRSDSFFPGLFT